MARLNPSCQIQNIRTTLSKHAPPSHFIAEGSAFQFLMGAMAAGASSREAVALACDYCDSCGQGIDTVDVREALKDEE